MEPSRIRLVLMLTIFLVLLVLKSLTMPSSVAEADSGGEGVADLNEDAPLLDPSEGDGSSFLVGVEAVVAAAEAEADDDGEKRFGECGLHDSFMRSIAAEHSDNTSSSSGRFSLVLRFLEPAIWT